MYSIQILLPLYTNNKKQIPEKYFKDLEKILVEKFHGITFYRQSPAEGLWAAKGAIVKDKIVIAEVDCTKINAKWWENFRKKLEIQFKQNEIIIKATKINRL